MTHTPNLKVAIAGLGAVCLPVAKWLDQGVPGFDLVAVSAGNKARAAEKIKDFKNPPPIVDLDELVSMGDIIVEGCRLSGILISPYRRSSRAKS